MLVFCTQGLQKKKTPTGRAGGESPSLSLPEMGGYAKAPLSILSRFPSHSELSWKSKPGQQHRMKKQLLHQMSEGDRTAEKSPVLCLQLSSLVPKNKASLQSTNSFQSLLPYNLYLHLQLLQPFLPCSFICTAASLPPHTKGVKWLHSMPLPVLQ